MRNGILGQLGSTLSPESSETLLLAASKHFSFFFSFAAAVKFLLDPSASDVNFCLPFLQVGVSKSTVGAPSVSNPREKLKKKMQLLLNKQCESSTFEELFGISRNFMK